ncbi:MAG: glycosyltransferase family 4 protein [Altererythrobacter sp.]|nr:glycosyltransferase family 4 protein [Altererythrobacter sp.]
MKIAIIGNGAQSLLNFRSTLMRLAVAEGHEVLAFAPDHSSASRQAVCALGAQPRDFSLSRSGLSPWSEALSLRSLHRQLSKDRPDAVLAYFIKPGIYGTIAARLAGIDRVVVLLEGLGFGFADEGAGRRRRLLGALIGKLLSFSLKHAAAVLVLNPDDREVLRSRAGLKEVENVGAIGVDLAQFPHKPQQVAGRMTFLMASRLIEEKGVYHFVEAARVFQEDPRARFVLLGGLDDNPSAITRQEVEGWRSAGLIEWPGQVGDVAERLAQCDVFVLPSFYREGVPRSIQEAMAIGRAVITTDSVGCRETVEDGVNGLLIKPRSSEALVAAIRSLLGEPERVSAMGRASRAMAERKFDAQVFDADLLRRLLGPRRSIQTLRGPHDHEQLNPAPEARRHR